MRLFKPVRVRLYVRPHASHHDGSSADRCLIIKLAAPVFEFTDCELRKGAIITVSEILAPLLRLRIIEKKCEPFDVTLPNPFS